MTGVISLPVASPHSRLACIAGGSLAALLHMHFMWQLCCQENTTGTRIPPATQPNSGQFSHIHVFHSLYFIPYIVLKDDVQKASLTFASGSLVGVGFKLVQAVVYCVLFVMMSTDIEKNSAVSEEGHVLTAWEN